MRNLQRVFAVAAILALMTALPGCEGKTGPAGPQGPQGEQGETGPQGPPGSGSSRTIMTGTVPTDQEPNLFWIPVAGLSMDDPPLVTVYVDLTSSGNDPEWDELPVPADFCDAQGQNCVTRVLYASIEEGGVTLWNCRGLNYIMIIVE